MGGTASRVEPHYNFKPYQEDTEGVAKYKVSSLDPKDSNPASGMDVYVRLCVCNMKQKTNSKSRKISNKET